MATTRASIIIRTYNEGLHLPALLESVARQQRDGFEVETIIVDSGSTDSTLAVAQRFDCRIEHIQKSEFTFGRSLNRGCEAARGDYLVFVSGHCVPASDDWLAALLRPFDRNDIAYVYGRQLGNETSKFSEIQHFDRYFPGASAVPQDGFFCNNANAALRQDAWLHHAFDEELTGLEDMELAKRLVAAGHKVAYVAEAPVYHLHDESWTTIRRRYEREAIALQKIMPEIHISAVDFARFFASAVYYDIKAARRQRAAGQLQPIVRYRLAQFWGAYRGNHEHRKLSKQMKELYFYPQQ